VIQSAVFLAGGLSAQRVWLSQHEAEVLTAVNTIRAVKHREQRPMQDLKNGSNCRWVCPGLP
jgi:hypothetical protein